MGFFDLFTGQARKKADLELEFIKDRNEIRLEHERKRKELEFSDKEKRAQLNNIMMDYKIKEQERKIQEDFEEFEDDEEEENSEQTLIKMFAPAINGMLTKQSTPQSQPPVSEVLPQTVQQESKKGGLTFSDTELEEIYKALPQVYKTIARGMTKEQIETFILNKYPNIEKECLNRMVLRVKQ